MQRVHFCAEATIPAVTIGHRERKKQRTREQIVEAAYRLFGERGYHATTVADIAFAADIAPRTFFAYFPSKEAVVFHEADAFCDAMAAAVGGRPEGQTAFEALRLWIEQMLPSEAVESEEAVLRKRMCAEDPSLAAQQRRILGRLEDVLREGVARDLGEPPDGLRPKLVAAAAVAALDAISNDGAGKQHGMAMLDETLAFLRGGVDALRKTD